MISSVEGVGRSVLTEDEILAFPVGQVAFWCEDCGAFELDPQEAVAHAKEFGHHFVADPDWFQEGNEELFAWNRVDVAPDDKTLTFGVIHPPPWIAGPSPTCWASSRLDFETLEDAVLARMRLVERRPGEPDALRGDDPDRAVTATLDEPLRGRVLVDGCAQLITPLETPRATATANAWDRVRVADDRSLVVYWPGGALDLDHISTDWQRDALLLTVWLSAPHESIRAVGQYQAAMVRLDRPIGTRRIKDGTAAR